MVMLLASAPSLKSGELFEFRGLLLHQFVERVGKEAPVILRTALHAAVVAITDAIEANHKLT
jgi:hypothetical protein